MARIKLPELPISKLELRRLRQRYKKVLNCTEGVDGDMVNESIDNYLLEEVDYKDKVCFDLGANVGGFTQIAIDSGAKMVYSVDCDPRNFAKLEKSFANDDFVELIFTAVSGLKDKTLKIYKSQSNNKHCSTSIMKKMKFGEYDEVPNTHIKKLFKKYQPDIVKIDVESAEYTMIDDILDYFPDVLFIEFHGGKHKELMEEMIQTFSEKYTQSRIEPLVVFGKVLAYDCFFKK